MNIDSLNVRLKEIVNHDSMYEGEEAFPRPNEIACQNVIKFCKILECLHIEITENNLFAFVDGGITIHLFRKDGFESDIDFYNDGDFIFGGHNPNDREQLVIELMSFIKEKLD